MNNILFFDDFNNGLSKWINFGSPKPYTKNGYYVPNGDANYPSGSYTKETFKIEDGLVLEFKAFQKPGTTWSMFYHIGFGKDVKYTERHIPITATFSIYGVHPDGNSQMSMAITCNVDGNTKKFLHKNDGKEHIYHIKFIGGKIKYYIDNTCLCEFENKFIGQKVPLIISGRSVTFTNGVDYVNGIKYIKLYKITPSTTEHTTTTTTHTTTQPVNTSQLLSTIQHVNTPQLLSTIQPNTNKIILGLLIGLIGIYLLSRK